MSTGEAAGAVEVLAPAGAIIAGHSLSPAEVKARAEWVRSVTKAALIEGVDYGVVPGTDRESLLKPGAEMLLLAAGLGFSITKIDDEDSRTHQGVTYRCSVHRGDLVVAECDGYAGYDESRYYISAEEAERREREFAEHDKRPARPAKMVEYKAPWNTLIKMAQKRALVGAALNAVAGSGLFPLDADDAGDAGDAGADGGSGGGRGRGRGSSRGRAAAAADATAVVARADALPEAERKVFTEWRESRNMPWPPPSSAVAKQATKELDRLEAIVKERGVESGELMSDETALAIRESFDALADRFPPGDQDVRLTYVSEVLGRVVADAGDLTANEAEEVLIALRSETKS